MRTTAISAMQVLTASWPWDLEIRIRLGINNFKLNREVEGISDVERASLNKKGIRGRLEEMMVVEWQERWDSCMTGRVTHAFFPNILERLAVGNLLTTWETSFLLTGKGELLSFLKQIGSRDDDV